MEWQRIPKISKTIFRLFTSTGPCNAFLYYHTVTLLPDSVGSGYLEPPATKFSNFSVISSYCTKHALSLHLSPETAQGRMAREQCTALRLRRHASWPSTFSSSSVTILTVTISANVHGADRWQHHAACDPEDCSPQRCSWNRPLSFIPTYCVFVCMGCFAYPVWLN